MATGYFLLDHKPRIQQCGKTRRGGAKASGTIILHDAEGGTDLVGADMGAENVANYIRNRTSYGSYHDLVDRDTHIPMAPIDYETWHSVPDNPWSLGICVAWTKADLPRMTPAQRRSYYVPLARTVLKRVAEFAARGITVPIGRMLTRSETQARKPGISTHSRTDPTRRSDPFGTGSVYETEFLTVLAELATPTPKETFMADLTEAEKKGFLDDVKAIRNRVDDKVLDGPAAGPASKQNWLEVPDAIRRLMIEQRAGFERAAKRDAAQTAIIRTLAEDKGINPDALLELLGAKIDEALAEVVLPLEGEITLTRKEN